jgi:hypothetical protein
MTRQQLAHVSRLRAGLTMPGHLEYSEQGEPRVPSLVAPIRSRDAYASIERISPRSERRQRTTRLLRHRAAQNGTSRIVGREGGFGYGPAPRARGRLL